MPILDRPQRFAAIASIVAIAIIALTIAINATGRPRLPVIGYHLAEIALPDRAAPSPIHLWYPAAEATTSQSPQLTDENLLFWGFDALVDAAPAPGSHPVVLLSHGSGGKPLRHSWLVTQLAAAGYIVAAPAHPGSTTGDSDQSTTLRLGLRSADLTATLDWLLTTPPVGLEPDASRIAALGFSMGGFSVLSLAGAQASLADFIDYCTTYAGQLDCGWYEEAGIDYTKIDPANFEVSRNDPRIRSIIAVDPAMPQAMKEATLLAIDVPVLILNLGLPGEVPEQFDAGRVAASIPQGRHRFIAGAVHFSFMTVCRPLGRLIIDRFGPDSICADEAARSRDVLQAEMMPLILDRLATTLP